jgi:hypothetical protein
VFVSDRPRSPPAWETPSSYARRTPNIRSTSPRT